MRLWICISIFTFVQKSWSLRGSRCDSVADWEKLTKNKSFQARSPAQEKLKKHEVAQTWCIAKWPASRGWLLEDLVPMFYNSFSLLLTGGSNKCMFAASLSRLVLCWREKLYSIPVNPNGMVKISTVDLLIKVACCVKKWTIFCNIKSSWSKLVGTRRSTVLSLPLQ
jgi:hypothetical protein